MKILITGGSGFIGKAFIKQYRKTFDIVAPTHAQMDLTDARAIDALFAKHKFDAVLHLAGTSERGGRAIEADNLIMFKNIQYMSIFHGVKKLIIVGEGAETDRRLPIVDFSEDMLGAAIPTDGYGVARYLISVLAAKDKITTNLRVFDIYGEGGNNTAINKIVAAAAKGRKQIKVERDRTVSGIYVDDAIKIIAAFLRGNYPKGDYNLVSGEKISYLDIAKQVKRMAKRDGFDPVIKLGSTERDLEYTAVNNKLESVLPFKYTTFKSGVKKLYESMRQGKRGGATPVAEDDETL